MATTWKKAKLGKQDINFDDAGTQATAAVEKSDGTTRTVNKVNASHIPTLATTRSQLTADNTAFTATDADAAIKELAAELNQIGIPDGTILTFNAGVLEIASTSITQGKMAEDSVDSPQYVNGSIDLIHLSADSVDGTKLVNNAVDSEHYTDDSIDNEHFSAASVGIVELNLDDNGGTMAVFPLISAETTWGSATNTLTITGITGAIATDTVIANFQQTNANGVSITQAYVSNVDELTFFSSGVGAASDVLGYIVYRATTAVS